MIEKSIWKCPRCGQEYPLNGGFMAYIQIYNVCCKDTAEYICYKCNYKQYEDEEYTKFVNKME